MHESYGVMSCVDQEARGVVWKFTNSNLIAHDIETKFVEIESDGEVCVELDDEIIKVSEEGDAIAAADASHKGVCMSGCWKRTDECEIVCEKGVIWPNKWVLNTSLSAEAMILSDLVNTVSSNAKELAYGSALACIDNKKVWEEVTKQEVKASSSSGNAGAIISKFRSLRDKSKICVIFEHVKTRGDDMEEGNARRKDMIMWCGKVAKEERNKCYLQHKNENIKVNGDFILRIKYEVMCRSVNEAVKEADSQRNLKDYVKEKYGELWKYVDLQARNYNSRYVESMIKYVTGLNMRGEHSKITKKNNKHNFCPMCMEEEPWDHVILCEYNKKYRDEYVSKLKMIANKISKNKEAFLNFLINFCQFLREIGVSLSKNRLKTTSYEVVLKLGLKRLDWSKKLT